MFVIKFIIGMMIIEVYFFANYFTGKKYMNDFNEAAQEMNMTASI